MKSSTQYLSYFIDTNTPIYGGVIDSINLIQTKSIDIGDTSNDHKITFPLHVGTHIDFPYHFDSNGKKSHDYTSAFWVFNKIGFISCDVDDIVTNLDILPKDIEILILKTGFSKYRNTSKYWSEQPIIKAELAGILKEHFPNIRVFGFDLISLTSKLDRLEGKRSHHNFLIKNDILIIEDMNLTELYTTPNMIIVSPLQIYGVDGVPCSILAIHNEVK